MSNSNGGGGPDRTEVIYKYVRDYIRQHCYGPVNREIAAGVGGKRKPLNTSIVDYHLSKLERAGRITRRPGDARTIRIPGARVIFQ